MLGSGRGFSTDLRNVFLPWPLPEGCAGQRLSCALALQASPTKELLAQLPLAHLNRHERHALQLAEAEEAIAWALEKWPGLAAALRDAAPQITPRRSVGLDADALLQRSLELARKRPLAAVPMICGQLPVVKSHLMSFAARRTQVESRLPWSNRKRLQRFTSWSVALTGEGDSAARAAEQGDENEDEERLLDERNARAGIPYPEWNVFSQSYREQHVSVIESRVRMQSTHKDDVDPRLAAWFEQPIDRSWRHRLEDGSDIDVDAVVDACSDDLARKLHANRLYRERLPAARDTACALLIDRSGSLSQAGNLKHELACANALAAAMDRARERHAVFAFWSDTRHQVAVEVLRDFNDGQRLHLDAKKLTPRGYTRIGGALRHVVMRLCKEPASRRVLLVLGDAIPCDEGYEGQYAAADVAKAVEEAEQYGVTVAFIAVGTPPDDPLADVLRGRFHRVTSLNSLAPVLAEVHSRLAS